MLEFWVGFACGLAVTPLGVILIAVLFRTVLKPFPEERSSER